jgi:2-polyprenyl-3-methyl-5-hydroxy-6-metoxy-1,4-benzoquinol methylase
LHSHGKTIVEIPIPTYYGDEICYVNGMQYAADVVADVAVFKLAQMGFTPGELTQVGDEYDLKESEGSSHTVILEMVEDHQPMKVLDVGCSGGLLGGLLRDQGHHVTGVDHLELADVRTRVDAFHQADLEQGLPQEVGTGYDLAVAADVLEHLRNSDSLLRDMGSRLEEGGRIIISVPNFGHWYPRLRTVLGVFDYDQRGILDKTHVRFFTRRSLLRMIKKNGFDVKRLETTGLPVDVVAGKRSALKRLVLAVDSLLVRLRPTLFAYQFVVEVEPVPPPRSVVWARTKR